MMVSNTIRRVTRMTVKCEEAQIVIQGNKHSKLTHTTFRLFKYRMHLLPILTQT